MGRFADHKGSGQKPHPNHNVIAFEFDDWRINAGLFGFNEAPVG